MSTPFPLRSPHNNRQSLLLIPLAPPLIQIDSMARTKKSARTGGQAEDKARKVAAKQTIKKDIKSRAPAPKANAKVSQSEPTPTPTPK